MAPPALRPRGRLGFRENRAGAATGEGQGAWAGPRGLLRRAACASKKNHKRRQSQGLHVASTPPARAPFPSLGELGYPEQVAFAVLEPGRFGVAEVRNSVDGLQVGVVVLLEAQAAGTQRAHVGRDITNDER